MLDEGSLYGDLLGVATPTVAPKPPGDGVLAGPEGPPGATTEADGDSPYGNLLEPMTPKGKSQDANDMFSEPTPAPSADQKNAQLGGKKGESPVSVTPGALPQSFSAAKMMMPQKLMMPPVRKKAEAPASGKKPVLTSLDIQRIQEEKEALMRQRAVTVEKKDDKVSSAKAPLAADEDKKESTAVPATSSTAGVASPSSPSTQNASQSLYANLYGSPDEEYDPAKPNDYDEFCRRRMRLKAEEEMERRRQDTLARQQAATKPPEPKEDDPAMKMMKKMGWKEGQGLGKDGQGMAAPLVMKKTDRATGVVVEGQKREAPAQAAGQPLAKQQKAAAPTGPPTRVILLNNLVGAGEVDEDLEEETAEEAGKYGKLKKCTIKEITGVPDDQAVRIFLEFETVQDATKALVDMNGRYFGGRVVRARFFDEARFSKGDLDKGADE